MKEQVPLSGGLGVQEKCRAAWCGVQISNIGVPRYINRRLILDVIAWRVAQKVCEYFHWGLETLETLYWLALYHGAPRTALLREQELGATAMPGLAGRTQMSNSRKPENVLIMDQVTGSSFRAGKSAVDYPFTAIKNNVGFVRLCFRNPRTASVRFKPRPK
jgi:hypothetical protein